MKQSRTNRIIIGVIGPCILGSLFFVSVFFLSKFANDFSIPNLNEFPEMLFFSFIMSIPFMGMQSIVYSLVMEFFISKKIDNIYIFIGGSILLGTVAGMSLSLMATARIDVFTVVGSLTGLILGYVLNLLDDKQLLER